MIASMFDANAKLPKTMGLVSTLLYFPRTNFIHPQHEKLNLRVRKDGVKNA